MKTIYLSGKISGMTREDYVKEFQIARQLVITKHNPCIIISPIELGDLLEQKHLKEKLEHPKWYDYMRICIGELTHCSHIVMLSNWKKSRGARIEHYLAKILKLEIIYL